MMPLNAYAHIAEKYNKMTKSEKKVADFLLVKTADPQLMSITSLAEACGVADGTIFRFCKTLGYSGYQDFKLVLAKTQGREQQAAGDDGDADIYSSIATEDSVQTTGHKLTAMYNAALEQTKQLLDCDEVTRAAKILQSSERVFCLGQGGSLIIAMEAMNRFITVSRNFTTMQDTHIQTIVASLLTEEDTIWFFSYSGSTKDMMNILGPAKARGAKIILVTRFAKSPASQFADVVLLCGSNESPLQSGAIVAKVAQLFVIDMVFQEYMRLSFDTLEQNRELTIKAIAGKLM